MKKRFKRMLAMALLGAMILSSGVFALAAEDPVVESGSETGMDPVENVEPEVGTPLPKPLGFDFRSVYVSAGTGSAAFNVTILSAAIKDEKGKLINYGIAGYDQKTKKASALSGQSWQTPDDTGTVTFHGLTGTNFIVTSAISTSKSPAEYYNSSKSEDRGVEFTLPAENFYDQMEPVDSTDVARKSGKMTIKNTKEDHLYAAFDTTDGKLVTTWVEGNAGELTLSFQAPTTNLVLAVTRVDPTKKHFIEPVTPVVVPGGDVAFTKTGFSDRTAMGVLTVTVTDGLEYAVANEDGKILNVFQRVRWQVTAESDAGLNIMPDETDFYRAPLGAKEIRFRVPPGGKFIIVTRFPNGITSRVDSPYQVPAVGNNLTWRDRFDEWYRVWYREYRIDPACPVAEYAAMNRKTGQTTRYYSSTSGVVQFNSNIPIELSVVVARPISLTGPSEGTPSPGQGSPTQETMPPVLHKTVIGTGETKDGQRLTAGTWDADNSPFESGSAAVEDALSSMAGKSLDPQNFSGAALATVAIDPFTMIVLYDWDGKPSSVLYFYDSKWYLTEPVDLNDGTYMVNFKSGIAGYVDIASSAG